MDDLKVIGDDIYFGPYKLGSKPRPMPATQWDAIVAAIEDIANDYDRAAHEAHDAGYSEGKRDGRNEALRE